MERKEACAEAMAKVLSEQLAGHGLTIYANSRMD